MFSTCYKQDNQESYIDLGGYSSEYATSDDQVAWVELYDNDHWNVPIHRIEYGGQDIGVYDYLETAMIDTGTALVYLETEVMDAWFKTLDERHPGLCDQYFFDAYPACYCNS